MAITTAGDIVRKALSKILVLGTQDTLADVDMQDGIDALNSMLDSWWNESLAVYSIRQENFPITANVASYTVGPAATWNTTRPTRILNAFARYQGVDYPVTPIDRLQYDPIPYKTTGGIPLVLFYDRAYPQGTVTLYPVPNLAMTLYFDSYLQIQSFADKDASISLPPGYARALIFNLACEIAPDYNKEPGPSLLKSAAESKGILKRNNRQDVTMKFDYALLYGSPAYNVYSDTYR